MHVDEVTLAGRPPLRLALHPHLTLVTNCPADDRHEICQALPPAFYGFDVASIVRWVDGAGTRRLVTTTDAVVPKVTIIDSARLGGRDDRVLDLLTTARVPPTSMAPGLAVLDEPFEHCSARETWELLDLVSRLSAKVQALYLTSDPCVQAWAEHHPEDLVVIDLLAESTRIQAP